MLLSYTAYYFLARSLPGIIGFLAITIYTRLLVPDDYGQYALALAAVSFLNSTFFLWLQYGLLRFLPRHSDRPDVLLATLLTAYLILVALSAGLGGIAYWYSTTDTWKSLIILVVVLACAQAWFELNLQLMASRLKPQRFGILATSKAILALVLGVCFVILGLKVHGPLLGLLVGMLTTTLILSSREWHGVRIAVADAQLFRDLCKYGLPLSLTFLLTFLVSSSDRFLIAWIIDKNAAGLYSAGYDLTQYAMSTLMAIVNLAAYPLIVRALEQSGSKAAHIELSKYSKVLFIISFPASLGFIMLAGNISEVLLGAAFRQSAELLMPLISIAALIGGLRALYFDLSFQLGQKTIGQVWVLLVAASVNFIFNLFWIPSFGLLGAAYAFILANSAALILSAWFGRKIFSLPPLTTVHVKIVLAALTMAGALWFMRSFHGAGMLLLQVMTGITVYGLALVMLNVVDWRHGAEKMIHRLRYRRNG